MIPHERSLVTKFKNRPFALIGVNSDGTDTEAGLANYRRNAEQMNVNWRSFRNEGSSPPISQAWNVRGWPTLYYIDHRGIIRHKDVRDPQEMEKVLESLIREAEAEKRGGGAAF